MLLPSIFREDPAENFFGFPAMNVFDDIDRQLYGKHASRMMKTDVREKDDQYEVIIDLPGFQKDELAVELKDGYLTVNAAKGLDKEHNDKDGKLIRQERYSGSMTRSFYVGENIDVADIQADYKHGVLRLIVPKKVQDEKEEKHLIEIKD